MIKRPKDTTLQEAELWYMLITVRMICLVLQTVLGLRGMKVKSGIRQKEKITHEEDQGNPGPREHTVVYHSQGHSRMTVPTLIGERPLTSVCPLDLFSFHDLKTEACYILKQTTVQKILFLDIKTVSCTEGCLSIFSFQPGATFDMGGFSCHRWRAFHVSGLILIHFSVKKVNMKTNKQSLLQLKLNRHSHFSFHQCKSLVLLVKTAPANLKARANCQHCTNTEKCVKSACIWQN